MNEMISPRKLAANRANARRSTGPRTAAGKAASKSNARKHGMLSTQVLMRGLSHEESEQELRELHRRFTEDLQPAGPVEEMLVDQIVTARWRLGRVLKAEAGEIAVNMDEGFWERNREEPRAFLWSKWERMGDAVEEMERSSLGSEMLEAWLKELRAAVEKDGEMTEAAVEEFERGFHGNPNKLTREREWLAQELQMNPDNLDEAALRERNKTRALEWLDRKITWFYIHKNLCKSYEEGIEKSRMAASVLPSAETLEKISRYEATLERQLYRAMAQLERIQRLRQGEAVPPPITMEVRQ